MNILGLVVLFLGIAELKISLALFPGTCLWFLTPVALQVGAATILVAVFQLIRNPSLFRKTAHGHIPVWTYVFLWPYLVAYRFNVFLRRVVVRSEPVVTQVCEGWFLAGWVNDEAHIHDAMLAAVAGAAAASTSAPTGAASGSTALSPSCSSPSSSSSSAQQQSQLPLRVALLDLTCELPRRLELTPATHTTTTTTMTSSNSNTNNDSAVPACGAAAAAPALNSNNSNAHIVNSDGGGDRGLTLSSGEDTETEASGAAAAAAASAAAVVTQRKGNANNQHDEDRLRKPLLGEHQQQQDSSNSNSNAMSSSNSNAINGGGGGGGGGGKVLLSAYLNIPTWDRQAPSVQQVEQAAAWCQQRRSKGESVVVHCAFGHGRSTTCLLAGLVRTGAFGSVAEALAHVRHKRPRVAMSREQLRTLALWNETYQQQKQHQQQVQQQ